FVMEEQFGWRIEKNSPNTVQILDTQDLHFLRRARQKAIENSTPLQLETDDLWRELGSIYRCDLTLILSDYEKSLLETEFQVPKELLHLYRFHYPKAPAPVP